MAKEAGNRDHATSQSNTGVKRRGLLRFGTLITAFTGASAISAFGANKAEAGPGDKPSPTTYVPMSEKGAPLGVANLDMESRIPRALLPDLSSTYGPDAVGFTTKFPKKTNLPVNVKDFSAVGDGLADDTAAINAAISYIGSFPESALSGRFRNKPTLYFPAGVYRITAGLSKITFRALHVTGAGAHNTAILFDSVADAPVFDFGTFSATPTDLHGGLQDARLEGIRIQHNAPSVAGSRVGQGVRSSGGGGLVLNDVAVLGFKYGINSPYGGDFNNYTDVRAEYCDVGFYQGPGGQQFITHNLNAYLCREGVVMDRWGHAHFTMPIFNSSGIAGLVIEAISDTATRQITFNPSGTSYQSKLVVQTPWFEGNAGGLGDAYIPTNFIENRNGGSDAYRDIEIVDPFIIAGSAGGKTTTAFFGNVSGKAAQRVGVRRPVLQGGMTRWFTSGSGYVLDNPRTRAGYTAPAFNDSVMVYKVLDGNKRTTGLLPWADTTDSADGAHGISVEYGQGGVLRYGFLNAGSYLYRAGFDIQNRRMYLDDPSSPTAFHVGRASAMPTAGSYGVGSFVHNTAPSVSAGKVLLGWKRLTTGSGHVDGRDWTPVYATTS